MNDDIQKFLDRAEKAIDAPKKSPHHRLEMGLEAVPSKPQDDDEKPAGDFVQYAKVANGFVPVSDTIRILPSDCYKLGIVHNQLAFVPNPIVTDDLIPMPDSKSDAVVAEVEKFWTLKSKFKQYGFSHKRGILLWGPPGSGKTGTIDMIIHKMVAAGGLVIIADNPSWLAEMLGRLRSVEPDRPVVVIWEDLDAIVERMGESEVLAVLDGESQVENIVVIATTNYPERLGERLLNRPSRFDRIVFVDVPNSESRALYFTKKLGFTTAEGIDLVEATSGMSFAHMREIIASGWCYGSNLRETIDRLRKMEKLPTSDKHSPVGF